MLFLGITTSLGVPSLNENNMYIRKKNDWEMYLNVKPEGMICEEENCNCLIHVWDKKTGAVSGFSGYEDAEKFFNEKSGAKSFIECGYDINKFING